jgi:hypothetical protein
MKRDKRKPQRETIQGWIPPKPLGWNQLDQRQAHEALFFDGTIVHDLAIEDLSEGVRSGSILHHDTVSMYYYHGQFWCVKYDAIVCPVDDGLHGSITGGAREYNAVPQPHTEDWQRLGFNHGERIAWNKSTVAVPAVSDRLDVERQDQSIWTERMIPHVARAPLERRGVLDRHYAGLDGDLSLLVGLIAFSVGQTHAGYALKQCIKSREMGGWWGHGGVAGIGCNALQFSI